MMDYSRWIGRDATMRITVLLLSLLCGCVAGATEFTAGNAPRSAVIGVTHESVSFEWGYTLDANDKLFSYACGYWNQSKFVDVVTQAVGSTELKVIEKQANPSLQGRVKVDARGKAFILQKLQYDDGGVFACYIVFGPVAGGPPVQKYSSNSTLLVEGRPEFCSPFPKQQNVTEGAALSLTLSICANPKPDISWTYGSLTVQTPPDNVIAISESDHKYETTLFADSLSKSLCGQRFTCFAINKYQQNITHTTIFMTFVPDAPNRVHAYYLNETCIQASWGKPSIGSCSQSYHLDYYIKDRLVARKDIIDTTVTKHMTCFNLTANENITLVNIIAFTSLGEMNTSATVSFTPPPPRVVDPEKRSSSKIYIILGIVVGIVLVVFLIATLCFFKKKRGNQAVDQEVNGSLKTKLHNSDRQTEMTTKPTKQPTEVIYAEANKGPVVYCELGSGGGRNPQRQPLNGAQSDYCEVKRKDDYDDELDAMVPPRRKAQIYN